MSQGLRLCCWHVIRKVIWYVTKLRIFEYSRNLFLIFFQSTKLRQPTGQRQLLEKKLILHNISKIRNFVTCQITFLMACQQHKSRIRQLLKSWIYSALSMVELLGIYKKWSIRIEGGLGISKRFFVEITGKKSY